MLHHIEVSRLYKKYKLKVTTLKLLLEKEVVDIVFIPYSIQLLKKIQDHRQCWLLCQTTDQTFEKF